MSTSPALKTAIQTVTGHFGGERSAFAYAAFEHINRSFFEGELPYPLIIWALTPHGRSLAYTLAERGQPPLIVLHLSLLGSDTAESPWGVPSEHLGPCFAYDVLLHECIHLSVKYRLGGGEPDSGFASHNNAVWIGEVNRIAPLLGLGKIQAGRSRVQRVPTDVLGPRGRPVTRVQRISEGAVPYRVASGFPYLLRVYLDKTDFYTRGELPFVW